MYENRTFKRDACEEATRETRSTAVRLMITTNPTSTEKMEMTIKNRYASFIKQERIRFSKTSLIRI